MSFYDLYLQQLLQSDLHILLIVFISIFTFYQLLKLCKNLSNNKAKKLPSLPRFPIIGNVLQIGDSPHRGLKSIAKRYGSLMKIQLGSTPFIVVSSNKVVEEIVKHHDIAFSYRPENIITKKLMYNSDELFAAPYGKKWKQIRSVCLSQIFSPKQVESLSSQYLREQETSSMIEKIRGFGSSPFDLSKLFEYLVKHMLYVATMNIKFSKGKDVEEKLTGIFKESNELIGEFNIGDFIPWMAWINCFNGFNKRAEKNHKEYDELMDEVIDQRILARRSETDDDEPKEKVLLDVLLDLQNSSSVTRDTIKAVILDLFAGGIDTVLVSFEWAMAELLRHPEMLNKAQEEVREIMRNAEKITKTELVKMRYLQAVIKESMRIHPPFPLMLRETTEEVELQGYQIPSKTRVLVNIYAVGRDPACWDEPDEFKPERFLKDGSESVKYNSQDYSWMVLGAGRRGCPAGTYGTSIIEYAIASLLHNFNLGLPDGKELDMNEVSVFALRKSEPLMVVATPHCNDV